MIIDAEISKMPKSGEFDEVIYDHQDAWNSSMWSWIKFTDHDYNEWYGSFRGISRNVTVANSEDSVFILTCDYLYKLDINSGKQLDVTESGGWKEFSVSPQGLIFVADYHTISYLNSDLKEVKALEPPFQMDEIEFLGWNNDLLQFKCIQFINECDHFILELDSHTFEFNIIEQKSIQCVIVKPWWKFW